MKRAIAASIAAHLAAGWLVFHRIHRDEPKIEEPHTVEISGETFDLPAEEQQTTQTTTSPVDIEDNGSDGIGEAPKQRKPVVNGTSTQVAPEPAKYGAVGERGSFELVPTFARAFVQTASADPIWATAPLGSAGSIDVTFTIDEHGALIATHKSNGGTEALQRGVDRTMALIGGRTFYANGAETRIRVHANIVAAEVHDSELFFAIGASGSSSFFALAIGRRIDVEITPLP